MQSLNFGWFSIRGKRLKVELKTKRYLADDHHGNDTGDGDEDAGSSVATSFIDEASAVADHSSTTLLSELSGSSAEYHHSRSAGSLFHDHRDDADPDAEEDVYSGAAAVMDEGILLKALPLEEISFAIDYMSKKDLAELSAKAE